MRGVCSAAFVLALTSCASTPAAQCRIDDLKLNQIQVFGTHNSYAQPVDPRLLALADPIAQRLYATFLPRMSAEQRALFAEEHPADLTLAQGLAYDHPPLAEQLDAGLRSLEIDVNYDPNGGAFADPAGYRLLRAQGVTDLAPHDTSPLHAPGFKVLHVADLDFRSHCPTLRLCLTQLRDWSDGHEGHAPIFIMLEAKTQSLPLFPEPTQAPAFDAAAFDELDAEIVETLGRERLIIPDDVRGDHETLEQAVRAGAWPKVEQARGKFVFLMLTALDRAGADLYLEGHPNLEGRVAFLRANPGHDHAAFLLLDNAMVRRSDIEARVREGYLVRTRADIETAEARANDLTRAQAAFASGAQVVSTDFFRPGNAFGTDYVVRLPGGGEARANPISAPDACRQASASR